MTDLEIGWTDPVSEREARIELIRSAWHGAYGSIFAKHEIDAIFDGDLEGQGSWGKNRLGPVGTLVARRSGEMLGLASIGLLIDGSGELAALYVRPADQRTGIGSALWQASRDVLRERGCTRMEVWTLARADAQRFYEARGCRRFAAGTFAAGGHVEPALGYAVDL